MGYKITAVVRKKQWEHKNINFIVGDLFDIEKFKILKSDFDIVVHMAAYVGMYEKFGRLFRDNYLVTEKIINFFKESGVYLIYFSSIEAFGPTTEIMVNEEDIPIPITDYGKIKLKIENLIKKSGIKYSILRIGNVESKNKGIIFSLKQLISQNTLYAKVQCFILKQLLSDYELNAIQINDISEIVSKLIVVKPNNKLYFATNQRVSMETLFGKANRKSILLFSLFIFVSRIVSYLKLSHIIGYIALGGFKRKYRNYNNKRIVSDLDIQFSKVL